MKDYELIDLHSLGDDRGQLIVFEKGVNCPFDVKRVFYIFDTKYDMSRGCHANKNSEFLLVVINGSCRVKIDNGKEQSDVLLNRPDKGLYLNKMVWKEMYEFSYNAVLMVLSNMPYHEEEYIRDYDKFKEMIKNA